MAADFKRRPAHVVAAVTVLAVMLTSCADSQPTGSGDGVTGPKRAGECGIADPTLAQLAQSRGKLFGTAYRSTFAIDDLCYREVALAEFDSLTTEIGTMMNTIQPVPGAFDPTCRARAAGS